MRRFLDGAADADSEEPVLTGPEAKAAARQYGLWICSWLALTVAALIIGWLLWHRSAVQLGYLYIGCSLLFMAALARRFGVIGLSYENSDTGTSLTQRLSFVPRKIAAPALAIAGLCLILAAASKAIASIVIPVATVGILVVLVVKATLGMVLGIGFLGLLVKALFSREDREGRKDRIDRKGAGCLLSFIIFSALLTYAYARFTGRLQEVWSYLDDSVQPFRDMWHLLGG